MAGLIRYCLVGLLLVSPLSFAGKTIIVEPHQVTRFYEPGQGSHAYSDSRNWNQPISTQNGRINVPVTLKSSMSWATFRSKAASLLKLNPGQVVGGAAVAGALAAVDWLFDPENNSLQKKEDSPVIPTADLRWCYYSDCHPTPQLYASSFAAQNPTYTCPVQFTTVSQNQVMVTFAAPGLSCSQPSASASPTLTRYGTCPTGTVYDSSKFGCVSTNAQYVPVVPSDVDSLVSGWSDPSIPLEMAPSIQTVPSDFDTTTFSGPSSVPGQSTTSTSVDPVTGDQTVIQTDTTINLQYSTNPLTITHNTTTVNNTYNNGTLTGTTTTTTTDTNVSTPDPLLDIPTDCDFMPTVCAFIEWFKDPIEMPEPEFPEVADEDFERSHTVSFGGACPAPTAINTQLFGTVYFNWQPLCDLAGFIRYLVISGALLFAVYISLGISRNS